MIKKIKATVSEKIILAFLIFLGIFSLFSFITIKNKCLFIKDIDPNRIKTAGFGEREPVRSNDTKEEP